MGEKLIEELVGDAGTGEDWAWVRLRVEAGRIAGAAGEGPGIAELCERAGGLTPLEAAAVSGEPLATDALATALGPAVRGDPHPWRAAVAMSGGVDSAVALLRVRAAGYEPVGVTLRLWLDPAGPDTERACCSPLAVRSARELCHDLGVPHVTLDLREGFRRTVVAPFVDGYARGETPNPCTTCNGRFRFDELLAFAERVGAPLLATGHYTRIRRHRGRLLLARATDTRKDQSYMLGTLDPAVLERLWFPLGCSSKDETRAEARAAGLPVADRPESQEACFLAGADYRDFLARHGLPPRSGPVVDLDGRSIGEHRGYWGFTPGQRRGLGLSAQQRLYAIRSEPAANAVVVGPREALERSSIAVRAGRLYVPVERVEAKLRYRSSAVPARVTPDGDGFRLELDAPARGIASGQTAVLYEDDAVVGAGVIAAAA
jgi:tRNA-specific 2-thiouridylase